ncbi:MAG: rod shape-determining protein RodA [Endomicrobium sp.]|nr:rod shape-determining protein RodA [Endomicrobium sp.]
MIIREKDFFHRIIHNMDYCLIFAVMILLVIGFTAIYSSASNCIMTSFKYISVQFTALGLGFIAFIMLASFNYQYYEHTYKFIYTLSIILLSSVLIFGSVKRGTKGWFDFGFIAFQPVEIAKIMFILVLASILNRKKVKKGLFLIHIFLAFFGHLLFIMLQPDFSSTLSYFPITLVLLFVSGIDLFYLFCVIILCFFAMSIPLVKIFLLQMEFLQNSVFIANFIVSLKNSLTMIYIIVIIILFIMSCWWFLQKLRIKISIIYPLILCISILLGCMASVFIEKSLKDYQKKRLIVFLNPKIDPKSSGYNITQSKIAIGSGKLFGKGFKNGTQTQLGFLPEQHTDFIFSVIGEEGGWIMSQLTLIFYWIFIWRSLIISKEARDKYGSFVALGLASMFTFYAVINIGMVMGIMPVTGIPLPFLSYGGSSIFSSLCAIGILCSISIRKHTYY